MKRVLIFSLAYYPDPVSGAEVAIKEITDRIAPEEVAFDMVTLRFKKESPLVEVIGNVRLHRVAGGGSYVSKVLFPFLAAAAAYRLHRKNPYGAFWAMMSYMVVPITLLRLFRVRVPYVLTLQEGDTEAYTFSRWHIRPILPLINYGFRHATVVQTISTYLAGWAKRRGYRGEVLVIPNGASDATQSEYSAEELDLLRSKIGYQRGETLLVSISRLVPQKAIDVVLHALTLLPSNVKMLIVGDGTDRPMLEALTDELHLRERVSFVGQVDRTLTAKYRAIADIFVTPSRSEGLGIAFLSAMASGLPTIATQEGGLADFVFDAKRNPNQQPTAWAVDKDNPEQIAEAVKEILANPEQARVVATNAKKMVAERFNWDTIAKDMQHKVFLKVIKPITL